jgi:hypothetical protein
VAPLRKGPASEEGELTIRAAVLALLILGLLAPAASARPAIDPVARASAVCADHPNQAAAQRAADTRDADGDGIYCETLPCPCLKPGGGTPSRPAQEPATAPTRRGCTRPRGVQPITFSSTKYPTIKRHAERAIARGWPSILVLNSRGVDARRNRLLANFSTRRGFDRDEYPPAIGRGRGKGLVRGSNPRGWRADVAYVPASENRSHGSVLGIKLRRFCDGTKFRYVFY